MKTAKRVLAAVLTAALFLSLCTLSFAEGTIGVSVYGDKAGTQTALTEYLSDTFSLYFGADNFAIGEDKLNTYQFTIWYDPEYVEPETSAGESLIDVEGYSLVNEESKTTKTFIEPDSQAGKVYSGYTFSFSSFEKGFGASENVFNALASVTFETLKIGETRLMITAEDTTLLPVATDAENLKETLSVSLVNDEINLEIKRKSGTTTIGGSGTTSTKYTVTFVADGSTYKTATITSGKTATTPTAPAKEGYTFDGWYTDAGYTTAYDFSAKVTKNITLYAKFTESKKPDETVGPGTTTKKFPFEDVEKEDWFYEGTYYVWDNDMVKGVSETLFAPDMALTRGTLVTLIYRMEGEPAAPANSFTDVASGQWYENAVAWAAENEIVLGIGEGLFAPDTDITREQIAVILYKYTKFKGGDVSASADLSLFTDAEDISDWAVEAMQWAVGEGLIQGMGDGTVAPGASATRAEIATVLMRYMQK